MIRLQTLGFVAFLALGAAQAQEAHERPTPDRQSWSFAGPFGTYDQAQLQRGFQVFREVCSTCHSARLLSFRNLADSGGPGFSASQVKALAAEYQVQDGPDGDGKTYERPGRPADAFPAPYANPEAAKAALGAAPPDMSVLAKARGFSRGFPLFLVDPIMQYQEQGADYIDALLNGYSDPKDANHNDYYPGGHIAMVKPLSDGRVDYTDGSPKTVPQYAKDVTAFLSWMAEPTLDQRKKIGFRVLVFLAIFATLLFLTKRRIWSAAH